MPQIRKKVIDAMRAVMSDADYGFNAQFEAIRATYGLDPVVLDWSADSTSVINARVSEADAGRTQLADRVTLCISTGGTAWTNETRFAKWSGIVDGLLDFRIRSSHEEREEDDIEDYDIIERFVGAIEDAVIEVFSRAAINWGALGVVYAKPPDCPDRPDAVLFADGWEQAIPIHVGFKIDAT